MQRVLLSSKSIDDARFIKRYIETELPYEVFISQNPGDIESQLKAKSIHLLMVQSGNVITKDIAYALQLRNRGFVYPILVITDLLGQSNIDELNEKYKIYFIERPFELKALKGLARKLMSARVVPQQVFRRYRTNIPATLETFISGDRFETHMFNLSRGGAYFELPKKPNLGSGDLLRLKVELTDVDRKYNVHARVVWTTHKGHAAGGYGVGIKFMKSSDIYRGLLDRV